MMMAMVTTLDLIVVLQVTHLKTMQYLIYSRIIQANTKIPMEMALEITRVV